MSYKTLLQKKKKKKVQKRTKQCHPGAVVCAWILATQALGILRQENCFKTEASRGYRVSGQPPCVGQSMGLINYLVTCIQL